MSTFQLVPAEQAGPQALGILVPPGRRTLLIVRPRALPWDLLVVHSDRWSGPTTTFRDFGRDEATAAADGLYAALQNWAAGEVTGAISPTAEGGGYLVRAHVAVFPLLTCLRRAGQPYEPLLIADRPEAEDLARALMAVLHPTPDAGQEVYFNDRHFRPVSQDAR
jgi:hypothetical protein